MLKIVLLSFLAWGGDPNAQEKREAEAKRYEACTKKADSYNEEADCTWASIKRCMAMNLEAYCGSRDLWKEKRDGSQRRETDNDGK